MAAAELYPQEWFKTRFVQRICHNTELFNSGHPNYLQCTINGCSVYFVSKYEDEYGFRSVVYCIISHDLYSMILQLQNANRLDGQVLTDIDAHTLFTFNESFLEGNEPNYVF